MIGTHQERINGDPEPKGISTSYVERQNLTMRMGMRRFTRLTNAFSKKVENLAAAVSLHFMYYSFGQVLDLLAEGVGRSEEHTSELQSLRHLVCRLLLEKKKNT